MHPFANQRTKVLVLWYYLCLSLYPVPSSLIKKVTICSMPSVRLVGCTGTADIIKLFVRSGMK